jgi:hypothetical protein
MNAGQICGTKYLLPIVAIPLVLLPLLFTEWWTWPASMRPMHTAWIAGIGTPRAMVLPSGLSGVSGTLFSGAKARSFTGPKLLQHHIQLPQKSPAGLDRKSWCTKWAVVTTIFKPSEAILAAAALKGWAVVVVGDEGGAPFNISMESVVYLDVMEQRRLTADAAQYGMFARLLPWKHFGRKNLGYLFAISHGAEIIWDFDDDNSFKKGLEPKLPDSNLFQVRSCLIWT